MESFEEGVARDSEGTTLGAKLAVLACVVVILIVVAFLGVNGQYVDVEQASNVSEAAPTAVAAHDAKAGR